MDARQLDRHFAELKERCAKLPPEVQERALKGLMDVITLCELPREPGEQLALSISLDRQSEITHLSG